MAYDWPVGIQYNQTLGVGNRDRFYVLLGPQFALQGQGKFLKRPALFGQTACPTCPIDLEMTRILRSKLAGFPRMQPPSILRFPPLSRLMAKTLCQSANWGRPQRSLGQCGERHRAGPGIGVVVGMCRPAAWLVLLTLLATLSTLAADSACGEEPIEFNLLALSSSQAAARSLQSPARLLWDQQPLRDATAGVSQAYAVSVWIDRRIDPTQAVSYTPQTVAEVSAIWPEDSLGAKLEQVLRGAGCGVGLVENVVVAAPPLQLPKMQAAAVRLHDALQRQEGRLATEFRPLQWPELCTPQRLLDQIAQQWGIMIQGTLPHDLMHAGRLQEPTTLATQLTLLCGGFNQEAVMVAPQTLALQPLSAASRWSANYPKKQLNASNFTAARGAFVDSTVRCRNESCAVQGETNFHLAVQAHLPAGRGGSGAGASRATWNFEIANAPVKAIMESLAAGANLEIKWDPRCTESQQSQLLSLKVQQASLDELLQQVCEAAGLRFTRQDKQVLLQPN